MWYPLAHCNQCIFDGDTVQSPRPTQLVHMQTELGVDFVISPGWKYRPISSHILPQFPLVLVTAWQHDLMKCFAVLLSNGPTTILYCLTTRQGAVWGTTKAAPCEYKVWTIYSFQLPCSFHSCWSIHLDGDMKSHPYLIPILVNQPILWHIKSSCLDHRLPASCPSQHSRMGSCTESNRGGSSSVVAVYVLLPFWASMCGRMWEAMTGYWWGPLHTRSMHVRVGQQGSMYVCFCIP